MDVLKLWYK